jgi:hypothetical protein
MAVAKKNSKKPAGENLVMAIVAQVEEMMRKHVGAVLQFVEDSESRKEKVNFGVDIDCSESEPHVKVSIRYSQSVTDSRSVVLDDPNQGTFKPLVEAAESETKKKKKGNKDADAPIEAEENPAN